MIIYFNTEIYNLDLTAESDDIHKIVTIASDSLVRCFVNKDSYIGLSKELDKACEVSMTLRNRDRENSDLFIMKEDFNDPYILVCTPNEYGVKFSKYTKEGKLFQYNRLITKHNLPLRKAI